MLVFRYLALLVTGVALWFNVGAQKRLLLAHVRCSVVPCL